MIIGLSRDEVIDVIYDVIAVTMHDEAYCIAYTLKNCVPCLLLNRRQVSTYVTSRQHKPNKSKSEGSIFTCLNTQLMSIVTYIGHYIKYIVYYIY